MNVVHIKKENGYTLAEVLIVLTIFFLVITLTMVSFKPLVRQLQINYFFKQLQLDISYSQIYAISHFKDVNIIFYPESHRYEIIPGFNGSRLVNRSYSKGIKIELVTLPANVTFLANGTIRKAGKMYVHFYDDKYTFVFLFGKGQTYVEKW
ncbi:MAG TPA: type II secretion system protein [Bacillus bacterium]|nr:type II secretion system protein [Bacillus sp. (in: firmicutes)]